MKYLLDQMVKLGANDENKYPNLAPIMDLVQDIDLPDYDQLDRENAGMLFTDIYSEMQGNAMQHTALGPTAAKYLERMCKSNDQILRLAELVAKAEEANATISPDDIFNEISG